MQRNHRISGIPREFDERFMFPAEQYSGIMFVKGYCLLAMLRQVFFEPGSQIRFTGKRERGAKILNSFPI